MRPPRGTLRAKSYQPAGAGWPFFGLIFAPGTPESAKIAKVKKWGVFNVNLKKGYFFDFPDSGLCGLPGELLGGKCPDRHPAGRRIFAQFCP